MSDNTKIEWADATFNPWIGCTKVSPACDHCYAEAWDARWGHSWGPHQRRRTSAANWRRPLAWDRAAARAGKRTRVFCASLADVFDNDRSITSGWRGDLWHLIHRTPHLDWMLLTKRPQNISRYLRPEKYGRLPPWGDGWPNVWLGTTVEDQTEADRRIPHLLAVPAKVRFLSCEPLLGPVELWRWIGVHHHPDNNLKDQETRDAIFTIIAAARAKFRKENGHHGLDWIICGGESGPGARPMNPQWARSLRDQCVAAGVAFHFKQWGEWAPWDDDNWSLPGGWDDVEAHERARMLGGVEFLKVGKARAGRLLDGREWNQVP